MSLRDTMRKAASLLVEMPPETSEPEAATPPAATTGSPGARPGANAEPDLEELLSVLDKDRQGGKASGVAATTPRGAPAAMPTTAGAAGAAGAAKPGATKTVEQIVRDASGPNLDQIKVGPAATQPVSADGKVDFAAIYRQAGLPATPFSAEQMLEMLASLPPELPLATRRQTVKVTLGALGKTMGATPETIVADASRKLAALTAAVDTMGKQTEQFVAGAETEIAALQAKIEEKRKAIQATRQKMIQLTQGCEAESNRLDEVLEFFSLDVAPSKYAVTKPPVGAAQTNPAPPGQAPSSPKGA